jgi:hypothetical protein
MLTRHVKVSLDWTNSNLRTTNIHPYQGETWFSQRAAESALMTQESLTRIGTSVLLGFAFPHSQNRTTICYLGVTSGTLAQIEFWGPCQPRNS